MKVSKGEKRYQTAGEGAITGTVYGGAGGFAYGKLRKLPGKARLGALAGAGAGAVAGAAAHKAPKRDKDGKFTFKSSTSISPISVTRRSGNPVPIPSKSTKTDAYKGKRHVGYVDSQQTPFKPRDNHLVNVYTDAKFRGQGVAAAADRFNAAYSGKTRSYSGHRSDMGAKFAGKRDGKKPGNAGGQKVTDNMDAAWAWRRKDIAKRGDEAPRRRKHLALVDALPPNNQTPVKEMKKGSLKPISVAKALTPKAIKINANWVKAHAAEAAKPLNPNLKRKPRSMEMASIPRVSKSMPEAGSLLDMGNFILKNKSRGTDGRFR